MSGSVVNRSSISYAHVLYAPDWGTYDNAQYISPSSSALFATGPAPKDGLPWNFSTVWEPLPPITTTASNNAWIRIEVDVDANRQNGNEIAWIRPYGSATPFKIDSSPPTATTPTAVTRGDTSVKISWAPSTDAGCMGLTGYRILRNGTQVGSVTSGILTYADSGLQPGTSYSYAVAAYDNHDNSTVGGSITVSTTGSAPSTPIPAATVNTTQSAPDKAAVPTPISGSGSTPPSSGKVSDSNSPAPLTQSPSTISGNGGAVQPLSSLSGKSVALQTVRVDETSFAAADLSTSLDIKKGGIMHLSGTASPPGASIVVAVMGSERTEQVVSVEGQGTWSYDLDTSSFDTGSYRIAAAVQDTDGSRTPETNLMGFSLFTSLPGGASVVLRQQAPKDVSLIAYFLVFALVIVGIVGITLLYLKHKSPLSPQEEPTNES